MKIKVSCECKDFLVLGELTEFQGGLKSRTEFDVDKIVRSIRKYGIAFPLFVWRHGGVNHCLDGHGRLLALNKMREDGDTIPPLPVVYVDCKDEQAARDLLLRLNSQYGRMTADSVREFADGFDVDFTDLQLPCGVIDFDVADVQETEDDDDVPDADEKEEPDSQPGEMYELGNSILMCGDSTNAEDVARLMGGDKADMVFTDPPYNLETTGGSKGIMGQALKKQGKEIDFIADFDPSKFLEVLPLVFKNNMNAYVFSNKTLLPDYLVWARSSGYSFNVLVWKKPNAIPIRDSHRPDIEYLLVFRKNAIWNYAVPNVNYSRCLEYSRVKRTEENGEHPTIKPVELIENELLISSKEKSIVVDFFGGSGSTLIACEKNNRRCRIMELDPKYCDVIRRRYTKWAKENGKPITSGCLE